MIKHYVSSKVALGSSGGNFFSSYLVIVRHDYRITLLFKCRTKHILTSLILNGLGSKIPIFDEVGVGLFFSWLPFYRLTHVALDENFFSRL